MLALLLFQFSQPALQKLGLFLQRLIAAFELVHQRRVDALAYRQLRGQCRVALFALVESCLERDHGDQLNSSALDTSACYRENPRQYQLPIIKRCAKTPTLDAASSS